jgi:hypothetical protein
MPADDRVHERRKAAALARHYRDEESLSIAEIARRLGRAEATVKAYLYDPSYANKGPYTSLGAPRAVDGAPGREPTRASAGRNARRGGASPTLDPVRRSSARQGWWMGR